MKKIFKLIMIYHLTSIIGCTFFFEEKSIYDYGGMNSVTRRAHKRVEKFLQQCIKNKKPVKVSANTRIDSVIVNKKIKIIDIYLSSSFSYIPFREHNILMINEKMEKILYRPFRNYSFNIYSNNWPVEQLIPNFFRSNYSTYDRFRLAKDDFRGVPIVRNKSKPWQPANGLFNRNVALWHSHGWYYDNNLDCWKWQRPRLFQTVEDLGPMAFTIPYLVPMLENAGANLFIARERDYQVNEVVVDNDSEMDSTKIYKESSLNGFWNTGGAPGFAIGNPPYNKGVNPFNLGTYRFIKSDTLKTAEVVWIPTIPETGEYAVSISYAATDSNASDANYIVYHTGGKTEFVVNQKMGGHTWIHLGKFKFKEGLNEANGKVILHNKSEEKNKYISADAVRFGGGMGNVSRNGKLSGRPRFLEAARYYFQYAGMPDSLVYNLDSDSNDYRDDYRSRGEWVNYLKGSPYGPNRDRKAKGLGIPIDLSFAFHTDAGITQNDSVVGTMLIYSLEGADSTYFFPDSISRLANRDLADIVQSEIVKNIRNKYDQSWKRRALWDTDKSEAYRPNVPSAVLELLSHQNFNDMQFFHDPRFRFDTSRSIYKGILKFLTTHYQLPYVVQPLPVSHFQAFFNAEKEITLKWRATIDSLESTANAQGYIVYTRIEDNNFDNGFFVDKSEAIIKKLKSGLIYSFKITAVNAGGESFPSEILSVCCLDSLHTPLLIINGFDRIAPPTSIKTDKFTGFLDFLDEGVPDKFDLIYTGSQFDFDPKSELRDNESPGFGASYGEFETKIIPGNTKDFAYVHGKSIRESGLSFISVSDEAVMDKEIDITEYKYIDLILGEEKSTDWPKKKGGKQFQIFPDPLQKELVRFCQSKGNLFISGAYVGTDIFEQKHLVSSDIKFATDTLKYMLTSNYAARQGAVYAVDSLFSAIIKDFVFNTGYHPNIYKVEAPDAIEPTNHLAKSILRYTENNRSAAIGYAGEYRILIFGFPFETILAQNNRDLVMQAIINFFRSNN
jgi:hypothetical protein